MIVLIYMLNVYTLNVCIKLFYLIPAFSMPTLFLNINMTISLSSIFILDDHLNIYVKCSHTECMY